MPPNSAIAIEPVVSRRQLRAFLHLPWRLYAQDAYWVPPLLSEQRRLLSPKRNPFFRHAACQLFVARRGGEVCGRIAAIVDDRHNEIHGERTGFFGFFESVRDEGVAHRLLEAARDWVRQRGMTRLRGPVSPSTNYECGLLVEGFESSPVLMMPYNPRHYGELLEGFGLKKVRDLYAYWLDRSFQMPEKVRRVAERVARRQRFQVRSADLRNLQAEVARLMEVYNAAWQPNWGFVPMTPEEFTELARSLKPIALPEFLLMAEVEGRTVGFLLALPDINQVLKRLNGRLFPFGFLTLLRQLRRIKVLRALVMGFLPEYQQQGLAAALYMELMKRGLERGYEGLEMSWVLEDNTMMNRVAELIGGRRYKTYRLYEMSW